MQRPPYFVLNTPSFSLRQLQSGLRFFQKHLPWPVNSQEYAPPDPLFPFHEGAIKRVDDSRQCSGQQRLLLIELNRSQAPLFSQELEMLKTVLAEQCGNRFTIHIRGALTQGSVKWISLLFHHQTTVNPFCFLNVVIEQPHPPPWSWVELLQKAARTTPSYYTRYQDYPVSAADHEEKEGIPFSLILPEEEAVDFLGKLTSREKITIGALVEIRSLKQAGEWLSQRHPWRLFYIWDINKHLPAREQVKIISLVHNFLFHQKLFMKGLSSPPLDEKGLLSPEKRDFHKVYFHGKQNELPDKQVSRERIMISFRDWAQIRLFSGGHAKLEGPELSAGVMIYRPGDGVFLRCSDRSKASHELGQLVLSLLKLKRG